MQNIMLLIANRNITPEISGVEMIYTQLFLLDMGAIKNVDGFLSSLHTAKHAVGILRRQSRASYADVAIIFRHLYIDRVKHVAGIFQYTNLFGQ